MGVEVYLVRDDNRTLYELGKTRGGLHVPLEDLQDKSGTVVLSDADVLMEFLLDGILEHGSWEQPFDYRPMATTLAERMCRWGGGKPVRVAYESDVGELEWRDEDRYVITDSRYESEFLYYDTYSTLDRNVQEQIDYNKGCPSDQPAMRHMLSYRVHRFTRPNSVFIPTEEGFVQKPKEMIQQEFLDEMKALKPLTTNRGCGVFACTILGPHDHGLRDTNTKAELLFCNCDCHDNPVVCTGFHFCCHEINQPRKDQTPRPPQKPFVVPEFKTFTFPVIRKPFPKLIAEDLVSVDPGCKELFKDVARHMLEVSAAMQVKEPLPQTTFGHKKLLSREEMEKLSTKRLLAYKNSLYKYPEGPSYEEQHYGGKDYGLYKSHPNWQAAMKLAKEVLAERENV